MRRGLIRPRIAIDLAVCEDWMPVCIGANSDLNGRKQVGKNGNQGEDRLREAKVEDHDAIQRASQRHKRHGHCGVNKSKLEAFEEHGLV